MERDGKGEDDIWCPKGTCYLARFSIFLLCSPISVYFVYSEIYNSLFIIQFVLIIFIGFRGRFSKYVNLTKIQS